MGMGSYDSRPETWRHIHTVQRFLLQVVHGLLERAHQHDQSKLSDAELAVFNEYTPKLRETTYGSEEYERYREAMGEALEHHYTNNSHHPEHYEGGIEGMDLLDLIEMLADWRAATERHDDGDMRRSLHQNRDRFDIDDQLHEILLNTVERLGWADRPNGEDEDG